MCYPFWVSACVHTTVYLGVVSSLASAPTGPPLSYCGYCQDGGINRTKGKVACMAAPLLQGYDFKEDACDTVAGRAIVPTRGVHRVSSGHLPPLKNRIKLFALFDSIQLSSVWNYPFSFFNIQSS